MKQLWRHYCQTFKNIAADSSILTTLVLSVFLYSFFYPTAYQSQQAEALPIVIADEEQSAMSAAIISQVAKSPNVEIKAITGNFAEAEQMIETQQADGILLLPENLSNSISRGETGGIGLYLSAANFLKTKQIGLGLASSIEHALAEQAEKFGSISHFSPAISVHQIPLFNTLSGYGSYIFPAVAPLIIHQTVLLGVCMLIAGYRERRWQLQRAEMAGIFLAILTIGCLGCFYLFGFTFWLYDYPRGGNFLGMLFSVPIYIGCIISLALLCASFLDMPERTGHVFVFTSIPLFLLSGAAWPLAAMPEWMHIAALALPSTQGIQMFIQLNQMGVPSAYVWPKLLYLFIFGLCCFGIAYYRLKLQVNSIKKDA